MPREPGESLWQKEQENVFLSVSPSVCLSTPFGVNDDANSPLKRSAQVLFWVD